MPRLQKGIGALLSAGIDKVQEAFTPPTNAEYGVDPILDEQIESQYINPDDELTESYIERVGRETGITADIQNIDTKILASYRMLEGPSDDIFNDPTLSDEEKVAAYDGRRDIAVNRIENLQKLQQGKLKEITDLSKLEADKEREKQATLKTAMELNKSILDTSRFTQEFGLKKTASETSQARLKLDQDKFSSSESVNSPLIVGDFSNLAVGDTYNGWPVSQTYGTDSVLGADNVLLVNGETGTPGVDFVGEVGDQIIAYSGGKVVKVVNGEGNYGVGEGKRVGYGNQVIVEDASGNKHFYNHLDQGSVKVGQLVQKGSVLGTMGNSGSSTGPHLDYRVSSGRGWEDPRTYMTKVAGKSEAKYDFSNVYDYLNSTDVKVNKNITPETAQKLLILDMQNFELPISGEGTKTKVPIVNTWEQLGKISKEEKKEYLDIRIAKQVYEPMSDEDLAERIREQDFEIMNENQRLSFLVKLGIAGKLDTSIDGLLDPGSQGFMWGAFNLDSSASGYIDDYFDDLPGSIILAQQIADTKIEEYNLK